MIEIKQLLLSLQKDNDQTLYVAQYNIKLNRLNELNLQLQDENIWSNQVAFQTLNKEKSQLDRLINSFNATTAALKDVQELFDMSVASGDDDLMKEVNAMLPELTSKIKQNKINSVFTSEHDFMDCFVEINAGAGGTDSQDWAQMLLRMYTMWAQSMNFTATLIDCIDGEEAGIKQATLQICGMLAFGYSKNETGIHRLVRISPFNASAKRQTSFASVFVYPAVSDTISIEIRDADLHIDTYRCSGAGGQHVNKTDSAVRIKHIPTGIVTQSQNQRSQVQNKAEAMKMLKSKLYNAQLQQQNDQRQKVEDAKTDISWGHQIRNYVLHPYQLVKDARSGFETSQAQSVLDGNLQPIIESLLLQINII
jgi:peptide chain release factor 2